jgi:hypothetical protein
MYGNMVEKSVLNPGGTYLFTKEILGINVWFPQNKMKWAIETGRKNLAIFLLPVGNVLAFTIVKSKLLLVIEFHQKEVLENVPKECKDQSYLLTADDLEKYIAGELPPLAENDSKTYKGENLSLALRKRFANFLQSFSIKYNRHYKRKDRLSARYTGIFELENSEDIKKTIAEIQNTPLLFDDARDLKICSTNTYQIEDREIQKFISYRKVIDLFEGSIKVFQEAVKEVRKRLQNNTKEYAYLQEVPPGAYFRTG